jgi:anti-sigma factor RsiW
MNAEQDSARGEPIGCTELVELVTAYLDRAMSEEEHLRFERHMAQCADCGVYVEQMRVTIHTVKTLHAESLHPEARARLLQVFRNWRKEASGG